VCVLHWLRYTFRTPGGMLMAVVGRALHGDGNGLSISCQLSSRGETSGFREVDIKAAAHL